MSIQINETDVINDSRKGIFQSANVGAFSNPTRPGSAATGDIIYSTTDSKLQVWNGSAWVAAGGGVEISATGGTVTTSADGFYTLHTFTSPGTFTLSTNGAVIDYFLIGGGGAGGNSSPGGGGGGGGHILEYARVWASGSYSVSIGAGGGARTDPFYQLAGQNGSNTTLGCPPSISAPGTLTALGGGGGGGSSVPFPSGLSPVSAAQPGGCGGGGGNISPSFGTPSNPNQGSAGNGGGQWRMSPYQPTETFAGGGGGIGAPGGGGYTGSQDSGGVGYLSKSRSRGIPGFYLNWASPTKTFYGGGGFGGPIRSPYNPAGPTQPVTPTIPDTTNGAGSTGARGGGGDGWSGPSTAPAPPTGTGIAGVVIIRYAKVQNL